MWLFQLVEKRRRKMRVEGTKKLFVELNSLSCSMEEAESRSILWEFEKGRRWLFLANLRMKKG